ncbi:hypothetical protein [Botrimarina sp.]|uniref:hypothetical protein n=1 Tax=Botrimarina sp. TaxID=2795802 RepID=UPI0032EF418C
MDFINPLIAQVRELFASMTPGARVTAGLLLAVVVVSLGFLFQQAATGPDEYLFGGTPIGRERLARVEAAIAGAGIDYTIEGERIKVARRDRNDAIAAVAEARELPPSFHSLMEEAVNGGSVLDFRGTKEQRVRAANEHRASIILSKLSFVDQAFVMHHVRQTQGLQRGRHATAAVSVEPVVGQSLTPTRVATIKDFVSKALDVPVEEIEVTSLGPDRIADTGEGVSPEEIDHPYFRNIAIQERRIKDSILQALADIPGVRVQVNARIDNVAQMQIRSVKPEPDPVTVARSSIDESETRIDAGPAERVGLEQNGPTPAPGEGLAAADRTERTNEVSDQQNVVGSSTEVRTMAGFKLEEAEATVVIPESYVEFVYRQDNADANGAPPAAIDRAVLEQTRESIKEKVKDIVKPILPKLALGQDEYAQVNVNFLRDLPKPPIPTPSMASGAMAIAQEYGGGVAMLGLAVFSLVMLRSVVSGGKTPPPAGLPSLQLAADEQDRAEGDDDEPDRPKLKLKKPDTLKDDLTDMVATDPDAAAAILRSWINNSDNAAA